MERTVDSSHRVDALSHLAHCARCRATLAALSRVFADPAVQAALPDPKRVIRRVAAVAAPLAVAAALLLVVFLPRGTTPVAEPHRGTGAQDMPVAMSPIGVVSEARALRWAPVGGADRYRVTLFDAESRVRFTVESSDTVAVLPDTVALIPGQQYSWLVEARTGWERWSASSPVTFSIPVPHQ